MKKEQALKLMVSPSDKRKGKPLGGVIQIHVTRLCDQSCYNCTQGSQYKLPREAKNSEKQYPLFMSLDQFERAVKSLVDYFGVVGLFGGNPALHPEFSELCAILRDYIPKERCGLWCNNPFNNGQAMRQTFNPAVSNLNVHLSQRAYDTFKRDWPESRPFGLNHDSRHSPCYVALQDVVEDVGERWDYISRCDINQHWSAMIGCFRGELRGWFCEIAGAQSILHQYEEDYPDTGLIIREGWWKPKMWDTEMSIQASWHCHQCGVPLSGHGELAQAASPTVGDQYSRSHEAVCRTKSGRPVQVVTNLVQLGSPLRKMTDYIGNGEFVCQ